MTPVASSGYDSATSGSGYDSAPGTPGGAKAKRVPNEPFRRIKAEQISFADDRLRDNSFAARVSIILLCAMGSY